HILRKKHNHLSLHDALPIYINTPTITNPQTGNLVDGTTVYNDATSGTGDDSVYPGIYVWNAGSPGKWVPQFIKRDQALYEQRTDLRPRSNGAAEAISFNKVLATPVAASSFTPKYRSEEHTSELQSRENLVC